LGYTVLSDNWTCMKNVLKRVFKQL
jgi:hypothetical protein